MTGRGKAEGATPSWITDHAFVPDGEWWRVCRVCRLAGAAHRDAEPDPEPVHDDPVWTLLRPSGAARRAVNGRVSHG